MSVTDLQVEVTGEDIKTLTCRTTCPLTGNPTYIWYKNGQPVVEEKSSFYVHKLSDEDRYSCAVKGHENLSPAVCNNDYCVTYSSQSICALKGSTVDLSCSYKYPRNYIIKTTEWYYWKNHDWKKIRDDNAGRVSYCGNKVNNCTLRITDLREEDSTSYYFSFSNWNLRKEGSSISLTVTDVVLEMEPPSVSVGNRVTLTCTTKCSLDPNPEYSWYKNGQPIENTNTNSTVHILSVRSEDAGRYSCGVKGHETLLSPEKTLNVTCKYIKDTVNCPYSLYIC
uniref:Ig-like domain-containing protein n=1 Tax=Esox lucius TaxID=8010 RepID=A0A3P9AEY9_ESOLU